MFEIYAYGNVDTLTGVFNAIAAIMGGADYFGLIKAIAITGVLVSLNHSSSAPVSVNRTSLPSGTGVLSPVNRSSVSESSSFMTTTLMGTSWTCKPDSAFP